MGSRLESGSSTVRKRIENHTFDGEDGEEYGASNFGGFGDYFRRKKLKLQNLDAEIRTTSPNNPPIFRGVVAHVNGYTQPSLNDLHRLIVSHGGGFLQYLDGKTAATHIIASSLTPKKREEFRKYRIVKPAWVVESVEAGKLLPWDSFRVIDGGVSQKVLRFGNEGQILSQHKSQSSSYRDQTKSSWYNSQISQQDVSIRAIDNRKGPTASPSHPNPTTNDPIQLETEKLDEDNVSLADPLRRADSLGVIGLSENNADVPMTSEKYNEHLLSNPLMRNSSVVNPDFIQQYYRESRLHHLSTWKAELKAKLREATLSKIPPTIVAKKGVFRDRRYILHVDFDCFFASVSIRKHPHLVDKPVAIAHGSGGGSEIASCNYPARAFGVKNGMWMQGALKLCSELTVLPYDFPAYEDASRKFYEAILDIEGIIQSVSIDEAFIDISNLCFDAAGSDGRGAASEDSIWREQAKADEVAHGLRDSVKRQTGCEVSVGIGGNILQAKLALRKAKPAGQFQLKPEDVLDFIGDISVQQLPGVAYSLGAKLGELNIKVVKDIRQLPKERLIANMGPKTGMKLWEYARGIDHSEVGDVTPRKSVSAEINWGIRFVTQEQAEQFVCNLCDELHRRLVENGVKGKQLTMRIMRRSSDAPLEPPKHLGHGKCDTFNKSIVLGVATNSNDKLGKEAVAILRHFNFAPGDLRGLGVQMTKLEPIKHDASGEMQNSQRQLDFGVSIPRKRAMSSDLDEITTPKKQECHLFVDNAPILTDESQKPLNVTGTQFILPSQVNSQALAELPGDIRSKLVSMRKRPRPTLQESESPSKRLLKPASPVALPHRSQLDLETLDALPEDVRAEVLAQYGLSSDSPPRPSAGSKKKRSKASTTPTKSQAIRDHSRPTTSKGRGNATLMQSNFILGRPSPSTSLPVDEDQGGSSVIDEGIESISEDFLAALPEDIRREVVEEQRRARLQKRGGLNIPDARKPAAPKPAGRPPEQKLLHFAPPPPKPTFTSRKLSSLPDLRDAMSEWYNSFQAEGPFEEDVSALAKYLRRVILEERDVAKAVAVVKWLDWLLDSSDDTDEDADGLSEAEQSKSLDAWKSALHRIRGDVNAAVGQRGLPLVEFT
ncbi:deoxycytidyl transferase [Ophidiomyces ophidiicola]|nr:deoxycytidyl transferase [Ophidiomyces ophidiicola]KAI1986975.1 deoxycytidyl transferase [Ophidiomyces ophidiicola]KAI1991110.1 deoxycytidyl transferase [Ophidiomyces ophidiicola]KAI1996290.1 deoxycytidyl transferase [Ophidiomyces ophidiicola]